METYITKHSEAQFSHNFCPECGKKYYAELLENNEDAGKKPANSLLAPS
jgi:hypothetical protein